MTGKTKKQLPKKNIVIAMLSIALLCMTLLVLKYQNANKKEVQLKLLPQEFFSTTDHQSRITIAKTVQQLVQPPTLQQTAQASARESLICVAIVSKASWAIMLYGGLGGAYSQCMDELLNSLD